MKRFIVLTLALTTLVACVTRTKIEYVDKPVPIYLTIHPERPTLLLQPLEWLYLPQEELFALSVEDFDKYNSNNAAIETYTKELQEGIIYYEQSTTGP